MKTLTNQQLTIPEDAYITPITNILESNPSQPIKTKQSVKKSLDELFPEQEYEEKAIKRAKEILGAIGDQFTEDQLRDKVAEIQFLVSTWLDDFEKSIFDGLTLQELLHEKGAM